MRRYPSENTLRLFSGLIGLIFFIFACSGSNEGQDKDANSTGKVKAKLVYFSIPG